MSDSDGPPRQGNRHHRKSGSRSPVSPKCAGKSPAEREEGQLAEAAVPVRPPADQPQATASDPEPPASDLAPAQGGACAAETADPTALPLEGAPDAQGAAAAALPSHAMAPGTPPAHGTVPDRTRGASPGTSAAAAESREGARYRAHSKPSHNQTSPHKLYPPKAAFPEGRPRPVYPPTPERTPPGITLPQLRQRVVEEGGDGHGGAGRGAYGSRQRVASGGGGQAPREYAAPAGSARRRTQKEGQDARGDGREQGHGRGARAGGSQGGQAHGTGKGTGSRRRDTRHGKGPGQGHGATGSGGEQAHGTCKGAGSGGRGTGQGMGHRQGHGKGTGASSVWKGKGAGDRGRDMRHGQGVRQERAHQG